jgi:hypothetical protein
VFLPFRLPSAVLSKEILIVMEDPLADPRATRWLREWKDDVASVEGDDIHRFHPLFVHFLRSLPFPP